MTVTPSTVDSIEQAGRFLAALGAEVGFDDAVTRIKARSSASVASELERLERYVRGESTARLDTALAAIGDVVRHAPDRDAVATAIGAMRRALADARALADNVRVGLPGDLYYAVLLVVVAGIVSVLWLRGIAPEFVALYSQMGATLPAFSLRIVEWPWLLLVPIGVLAGALVLLVVGTWRTARAIAALAPFPRRWLPLLGRGAARSHERWRTLATAHAWAAAGQEPSAALREALRVSGASGPALGMPSGDIELACELGVARDELEHQFQASLADYRERLELRRAVALRVIQVGVALIVGAIVIAIYLPIFEMGAIV